MTGQEQYRKNLADGRAGGITVWIDDVQTDIDKINVMVSLCTSDSGVEWNMHWTCITPLLELSGD